jgi:hypothetical protein
LNRPIQHVSHCSVDVRRFFKSIVNEHLIIFNYINLMLSDKSLLVLKISMYVALGAVTLMSFISMGIVGSNLTVWEEV